MNVVRAKGTIKYVSNGEKKIQKCLRDGGESKYSMKNLVSRNAFHLRGKWCNKPNIILPKIKVIQALMASNTFSAGDPNIADE